MRNVFGALAAGSFAAFVPRPLARLSAGSVAAVVCAVLAAVIGIALLPFRLVWALFAGLRAPSRIVWAIVDEFRQVRDRVMWFLAKAREDHYLVDLRQEPTIDVFEADSLAMQGILGRLSCAEVGQRLIELKIASQLSLGSIAEVEAIVGQSEFVPGVTIADAMRQTEGRVPGDGEGFINDFRPRCP